MTDPAPQFTPGERTHAEYRADATRRAVFVSVDRPRSDRGEPHTLERRAIRCRLAGFWTIRADIYAATAGG